MGWNHQVVWVSIHDSLPELGFLHFYVEPQLVFLQPKTIQPDSTIGNTTLGGGFKDFFLFTPT